MTDLNQGASIEAERAQDEVDAVDDLRKAVLDGATDEWLLGFVRGYPFARRTPPAPAGLSQATVAGELPPLAKPERHNFGVFAYTALQMRDYARAAILADRQRAGVEAPSDDGLPRWIDDQKGKDPLMDDMIAYIIDLRAQLAAKGQDNTQRTPSGWLYENATGYRRFYKPEEIDSPGFHADQAAAEEYPTGHSMTEYYAAPASAQPADDRQHMTHDEMLALCAADPAAASGLPLGAQPDRSAAPELPYVEGWSLPRDLPTAHAEIQKLRIAYAEAVAAAQPVAPLAQVSLQREQVSEQPQWISVEDRMPEGRYCLAVYETPRGHQRIIRAMYVRQYEVEATDDECDSEYNEADDRDYLKAGWLECIDNWGEYSSVYVTEGKVTHWMPLPATPGKQPHSTATEGADGMGGAV